MDLINSNKFLFVVLVIYIFLKNGYIPSTTERRKERKKKREGKLRGSRQVWPDLAKLCHFGKILLVFSNFLKVYFLFGKMLSLLWQLCFILGLIFIVTNGQILQINLTVWSHWVTHEAKLAQKNVLCRECLYAWAPIINFVQGVKTESVHQSPIEIHSKGENVIRSLSQKIAFERDL